MTLLQLLCSSLQVTFNWVLRKISRKPLILLTAGRVPLLLRIVTVVRLYLCSCGIICCANVVKLTLKCQFVYGICCNCLPRRLLELF